MSETLIGMIPSAHKSVDESNLLTLEWRNGKNKLTLFFDNGGCRYLKSWGPHIHNDMEDGECSDTNIDRLIEWLNTHGQL